MDQNEFSFIRVPYPDAKDLHFKIYAPVCTLVISPGIGNAWASGKYRDPRVLVPLIIDKTPNTAEIVADSAFAYRVQQKYWPEMKLSFGRTRPFSLSIRSGNLSNRLDFGGLPLTALEIQYGCGDQLINFSLPNPKELREIEIAADTGTTHIENLENANSTEIRLKGESNSYRLDFGGALKRNLNIHIGITVSKVKITIPSNIAVKITSEKNLTCSNMDDFSLVEGACYNSPARDHQEPLLTIDNTRTRASLWIEYTAIPSEAPQQEK